MLLFYCLAPIGGYVIAICAIITILGSVNGGILILTQDAMGAARKNLFPKFFADVNNRFKSPVKNIFVSGILMSIMILFTMNDALNKQFNFLILLSTLSLLIPYFISSTAAMTLFIKHPEMFNRKQFLTAFLAALASSLYAFWMMIGAGQEVIFYGCLFFFGIFWLHFIYKYSQSKFTLKLMP